MIAKRHRPDQRDRGSRNKRAFEEPATEPATARTVRAVAARPPRPSRWTAAGSVAPDATHDTIGSRPCSRRETAAAHTATATTLRLENYRIYRHRGTIREHSGRTRWHWE
jgi:hypothetical protein